MTRKDHHKNNLQGPWPTTAETLGARYGDQWDIWRELRPDGTHGDWIAKQISGRPESCDRRTQIQSRTIQGLAELLERAGSGTIANPQDVPRCRPAGLFWSDSGEPERERAALTLAARPDAPGAARRFVGAQLSKWRLGHLIDACQLVASELTTNAVRFAGDRTIIVGLRLTGRRLVCEVWDPSPEAPIPIEAGALDEGGRGLLLVATSADDWACYPSSAGTGKIVLAWWKLP